MIRIEFDPDYTDGLTGDPGFYGGHYVFLKPGKYQSMTIASILQAANVDPKNVVECDLTDLYDESGNLVDEVENNG